LAQAILKKNKSLLPQSVQSGLSHTFSMTTSGFEHVIFAFLVLASLLQDISAAQAGWATMWATTNQDLIGASCEFANAPVNSLSDPVLASYLRTSYHCAIGEEYGIGEHCGKCYRLTSTNNNGRHGTPGQVGSAVIMVSNSGAGGSNHFDCILESFQEITGATSGVFDITYEQTECTDVSGLPTIINWADQNAWYCKMMFENIGGWGSLHTVYACLDGGNCKYLQRFSGQTWTGCPVGTGSTMTFTLTQQSPAGKTSEILCTCSVGSWPWPTGTRCECPSNFVSGWSSETPTTTPATTGSCTTLGQDCRGSKCCSDPGLTCFEKDQWWASCRASCTPGVDHSEAPEYQTPWSCSVLSDDVLTTASTTSPSTASTTSPSSCMTPGQDCRTSKCCSDSGFTCYEKNQWWASCKASCTPGIDQNDPPEHQTPWSCVALSKEAIVSGQTIFLRTHAGSGKMIDIQDSTVRARWVDHGEWKAVLIQKAGGGTILSRDTVFLKAVHTGAFLDVQDESVQARWNETGTWQSLVVEKQFGDGALSPNDVVCFKAHTGKHIDVYDGEVQARWDDCGLWQQMRIETIATRRLRSEIPKVKKPLIV